MNVVESTWLAAGALVQAVIYFFFGTLVAAVIWGHFFRYSTGKKRLRRIAAYTADTDLSSDPDVEDYLHPHRPRVGLHNDNRFLLRVDRQAMLEELTESATPPNLAGYFTGVALFITFLLIGRVLVEDVHGALSAFSGANGALEAGSRSLAGAVSGLGAKFFISATGVFCSLVYMTCAERWGTWLAEEAAKTERKLRKVFASPDEYDGHLQRTHLEVLQSQFDVLEQICKNGHELRSDVSRLNSIEVSVQNLSEEVTLQLRKIITEDFGDKMEQMVGRALLDVRALAENLGAGLGAEVKAAAAQIPHVVSRLDAIKTAVAHQTQAPIEALLEKLSATITGGYQGETAQLGSTLRDFARVVPDMTRNFEEMGTKLLASLNTQQGRGEATQQRVIESVERLMGGFHEQHTSMTQELGRVQHDAAETTSGVVKALENQIATAAKEFATLAATQSEAMSRRLGSLSSEHEASLAAVNNNLRGVIDSFSIAQGALRDSASELQKIGGSTAQLLNGAHAVVQGVNDSAQSLRQGSEAARSVVDGAGSIVREAQAHAQTEMALTRELQSVWPGLLKQYTDSFEQKSKLLAASWDNTSKQVASLFDGTVLQLREPVDDLQLAVKDLQQAVKELAKVLPRSS